MAQSRRLQKVLFLGLCLLVVVGVIAQLFFTSKVKDFLEKQTPKDITLNYRNLGTNVFLGSISLEDLKLSSEGFELRSEEHTSELQSRENLVCRLLLEKKK